MRYQRFSQAKSTRTRGALLARRAASSRHCGSQRRPRSSQTKAASSQGAGPCSEAGSSRRLATGAKARSASSRPAEAAQDAVELQVLVPEGAQDQQRAPVPGLHGGLRRGRGAGRAPAGEQFEEAGGVGLERIDPAEVAEDALARSGAAIGQALAIGFLQAEILLGCAVGGADSDFAQVHGRDPRMSLRCQAWRTEKVKGNGDKYIAYTHYIVTAISGNQSLRR